MSLLILTATFIALLLHPAASFSSSFLPVPFLLPHHRHRSHFQHSIPSFSISTSLFAKNPANAARASALAALELLEKLETPTPDNNPASSPSPSSILQDAKKEKKRDKKAAKLQAEFEKNDDSPDDTKKSNSKRKKSSLSPTLPPPPPPPPIPPTEITLEDKIRANRPPPRVRVLASSQPGFASLKLENIAVTFRNQLVLSDVSWEVKTGDRVGLVGENGSGKTTQLRVMNDEIEPTTGDVVKSSADLRVAMLRQEFGDDLVMGRTLKDEFLSVFKDTLQILVDLRAAEVELEKCTIEEPEMMQDVIDKLQTLNESAENKGAYKLEAKVEKIMNLMGFNELEASAPVSSFSGGWKMRIGLGKVLLADPNVLLLDEPSNHLDMESMQWLEEFLKSQKIPMVIVSHDREFLDRVCNKIVDIEGGIASSYDGNYSKFLVTKTAKMKAWQAAYDIQEKKIKDERSWIQQFKTKQPVAVKQRVARLEKLLLSPDYVKKPTFTGKPLKFRFPPAPRLGDGEVARVENLKHGYDNNLLFNNTGLIVEKNDRIAILGPNGSGKSTLLRLIMGKEKAYSGTSELIGNNLVANFFEQNQADVLDLDKSVSETVADASSNHSYNELRALLGQFLFKGDSVDKKVRSLSGGEKARLSLCIMMLTPCNLLVLDEPTNHLDIPAKEMLEEALQNFEGALILVSHDRYFISRVATTIVNIEDHLLVKYPGDYRSYMNKHADVKEMVESRYMVGGTKIMDAVYVEKEKENNFGGSGVTGGRADKGVKNAKRLVPNW